MAKAKERSTTQRRGSNTKPRFASGSFTTSGSMPCLREACGRLLAGVALIDEGDLDVIVSGRLQGLGQTLDLSAVIGVGWRDVQGQKMAERVHRPVQLRALLALAPIVAGPLAALGRRAQRPAVEDRR
ncbi:hypothetical protein HNR51_004340 [Methylorubrum thiocyanatum]|uniref:Uncharacterized protein n=1 Tax=Methylorubrum thiocyanatum TaxID=47958 RepID=A0AA40VDK3_9HYPH|nr:hypothetical protein [Methylorubrum thiocyanatum]